MKKLVLFGIAIMMAACPVACVDDPTQDDSTMPCVDDVTDGVDSSDASEGADCTVGDVDVGDTDTAV